MASWNQLVGFVRQTYQVADTTPDRLSLVFGMSADRSQVVHLLRQVLGENEEEWVQIESPVCEASTERIEATARAAGDMVCGGVAVINDLVIFRHSVPLANLDVNEFERPLHLVTMAADYLETQVTGLDQF